VDYLDVKLVHQSAVAMSLTGFFVRGAASLAGAQWLRTRLAKTLPHVVDSVLLLSALALAWTAGLTPMNSPWLLAKIAGLVVYVGLGIVALSPRASKAVRAVAWVAALATAGWIVCVAITKNPLGYFASAASLLS
jgi:uncharacterized membrane protein SirB2